MFISQPGKSKKKKRKISEIKKKLEIGKFQKSGSLRKPQKN
jgi:hypothetical protein